MYDYEKYPQTGDDRPNIGYESQKTVQKTPVIPAPKIVSVPVNGGGAQGSNNPSDTPPVPPPV